MADEERTKPDEDATAKTVAVVGRRPEQCEPLSRAFQREGWEVLTCEGPARVTCPLFAGEDCDLRESVAAAIVYLDPRKESAAAARLIRCATTSSPSVVVLEGQVDPPRLEHGHLIVGSLRGPQVISAATVSLLETYAQQNRP